MGATAGAAGLFLAPVKRIEGNPHEEPVQGNRCRADRAIDPQRLTESFRPFVHLHDDEHAIQPDDNHSASPGGNFEPDRVGKLAHAAAVAG